MSGGGLTLRAMMWREGQIKRERRAWSNVMKVGGSADDLTKVMGCGESALRMMQLSLCWRLIREVAGSHETRLAKVSHGEII